jgi:hypothetical protein
MRNIRVICRLASLLLLGLSLLIVHHAQPIVAQAYNDLCSSQGMTFGEGLSVSLSQYNTRCCRCSAILGT